MEIERDMFINEQSLNNDPSWEFIEFAFDVGARNARLYDIVGHDGISILIGA